MRFLLGKFGITRIDAFVHPRGDYFEFDVGKGGVALWLLRGELAVRPVRKVFKQTLTATPGEPLMILAPGRYRACAKKLSIGVRGLI